MKWIGQSIVDYIARFRSDVYLEDISSGTIASGGNLGLNSNNKIVKAVGSDLSGLSDVAPTDGDKLATLDSDGANEQLTTVASLATLYAGTGLTAASSVINIDAAQSGITSLGTLTGLTLGGDKNYGATGDGAMIHLDTSTITDTDTAEEGTAALYTHVRLEGPKLAAAGVSVTTTDAATLYIKDAVSAHTNQTITNAYSLWVDAGNARFDGSINQTLGDYTLYDANNNANPTISLGSSATNRLKIEAEYNSDAQTLNEVNFTTNTASGTANDGRFVFNVDAVQMAIIHDTGLTVYGTDGILSAAAGASLKAQDSAASSATAGGTLLLQSDDGDRMADTHRLGVIEFKGAEDDANTRTTGARIQAVASSTWNGTTNDADLEFYTTRADAAESKVLTLDADKKATFEGSIRGKSIYVETCNLSDDLGTDEHFIPFVSTSESTAFANASTPWMAPVAGKLLKVHWRSSQHNNVSSNQMTFKLYKISDGTRWSGTNESILGAQIVTGPARTTHVIADFTSGLESGVGSETNAFAANDLLGVSVQHSAAQGTTEKITVTLVFELDFSSY